MKKNIIIGALLLIIGFVIGLLCRPDHLRDEVKMVQTDTIVRFDTIRIKEPIYVTSVVKDSMLVVVRDTIIKNDTCYIRLPLEKRTYKRDEFYAEVTGFEPRLTYIEVYPKTVVISKTETTTQTIRHDNRLRFGIESRYCSTLSTPIYLEYERMLHRNIGINAGMFYDLQLRQYGVVVGLNVQVGW